MQYAICNMQYIIEYNNNKKTIITKTHTIHGPGPGPGPQNWRCLLHAPCANFGVRARARAHVWYVFCVIIVFFVVIVFYYIYIYIFYIIVLRSED